MTKLVDVSQKNETSRTIEIVAITSIGNTLTTYIFKDGSGWYGCVLAIGDEHLSINEFKEKFGGSEKEEVEERISLYKATDDYIIEHNLYGGKGVYSNEIKELKG